MLSSGTKEARLVLVYYSRYSWWTEYSFLLQKWRISSWNNAWYYKLLQSSLTYRARERAKVNVNKVFVCIPFKWYKLALSIRMSVKFGASSWNFTLLLTSFELSSKVQWEVWNDISLSWSINCWVHGLRFRSFFSCCLLNTLFLEICCTSTEIIVYLVLCSKWLRSFGWNVLYWNELLFIHLIKITKISLEWIVISLEWKAKAQTSNRFWCD